MTESTADLIRALTELLHTASFTPNGSPELVKATEAKLLDLFNRI